MAGPNGGGYNGRVIEFYPQDCMRYFDMAKLSKLGLEKPPTAILLSVLRIQRECDAENQPKMVAF